MWSVFCRKNSSILQNELWSNLIAVCRNQSGPFLPLMSNHTNAYKCYRFRVPHCLIESSCSFSLKIYLVLNRYPRFSPDTFSSLSRYTPIHPTQIHVVLYTFALIQRLFQALHFIRLRFQTGKNYPYIYRTCTVHRAPTLFTLHLSLFQMLHRYPPSFTGFQIHMNIFFYMYHLSIIISSVIACLP